MTIRAFIMAFLLALVLWFNFGQDSSAAAASQRAFDLFDSRPARSILILGNSRTSQNDMPSMLRKIADSAGSPTKFQVETSLYGGATFKTHWEKPRSRNLLAARWDDVILQPESGAQACQVCNDDFLLYGPKLADAATVRQGRPRLIVGWAYDPKTYEEPGFKDYGYGRSDHLAQIRIMHAKLASKANMSRINVAGAWEQVRLVHPSIKLTFDGNHPTIAGSYLYALAVYAYLSNGSVAGVNYVPDGLTADDAKVLREAVDSIPLLD
jgi:hypothetical protein